MVDDLARTETVMAIRVSIMATRCQIVVIMPKVSIMAKGARFARLYGIRFPN